MIDLDVLLSNGIIASEPLSDSGHKMHEAKKEKLYDARHCCPIVQRNWWTLALRGLLAVIFGIIALVAPGIALLAFIYVFAAYALVDGGIADNVPAYPIIDEELDELFVVFLDSGVAKHLQTWIASMD